MLGDCGILQVSLMSKEFNPKNYTHYSLEEGKHIEE